MLKRIFIVILLLALTLCGCIGNIDVDVPERAHFYETLFGENELWNCNTNSTKIFAQLNSVGRRNYP